MADDAKGAAAEAGVETKKAEDLTNPDVVTKYRKAGEICNQALELVIKAAVAGAKIVDLCIAGDKFIVEQTGKIYNNKPKCEKGLAFPTCVSTNNVVGAFSPLAGDAVELQDGDVVKIDLGVHIDGYVALGAHTVVVGATEAIKGRQADAIAAARTAAECAIRLLKPGHKNSELTDIIAKVAADYKCSAVQGVLSHQMTRFVIDGKKVILNRAEADQKVDEIEFLPNEVYAMDIVMSTGDGKPKGSEDRTTVYKRNPDCTYALKRQASRQVFSDIQKRHQTFPFSLRDMEDEKKAKFGILELLEHQLVHAYPVIVEKPGDFVAHIKFTALLMPNGTLQITGLPDAVAVQSELKPSEAVAAVLNTAKSSSSSKNKKKKPAKKKEDAKPESA